MEGIVFSMDKSVAGEVAWEAMEEFMKMGVEKEEVFWCEGQEGRECVMEEEYMNQFSGRRGDPINSPQLKSDATRDAGEVFINTSSLVEAFMNTKQWKEMFCGIVRRAITVDVISGGGGGSQDGALLLIYAQLQVLSPLVPIRDVFFLRFCKKQEEGLWAVVDVSVDSDTKSSSPFKCRKRPSGCLIQDMSNGFSKVRWIEHWEYEESGIDSIYRAFISSGMGFGAHRWLATLQRQSERLATPGMQVSMDGGVRRLVRVGERMRKGFYWAVNNSEMLVRRKGAPPLLTAAASFSLPISPLSLFDFLRDGRRRHEWDMLSNGEAMRESVYVATGQDPGNNVSLLTPTGRSRTVIVQESWKDSSAFLLVYSPLDISQGKKVMKGEEDVPLLPCGFSILPTPPHHQQNGALFTLLIQMTVSTYNPPKATITPQSLKTVTNLISCTLRKIKSALLS